MRHHYLRLLTTVMLALIFPTLIFAQKIFTGHVVAGTDKTPVAGASVVIKGTRTGTSTAVDGTFAIRAKAGDVLVVSSIGVTPFSFTVTDETDPVITVEANSRELNEVVVTATGIKKESKKLGYALQTIDASTLTQAREPNPINALKGNAAGLTVNISSEIGHAPDVIIRGENSPEDRPMFVVDGVPFSSDTYNLNPDDIENFTILKGPNAAALYGFQGKNGAIIINTKRGSRFKNRIAVTVNTSTQFNKGFLALPKYQDTYGPGDNGKYAFGGGGSSPQSYFGSGAVGVGINDYDYDVWGPQFRGQLIPQYDGAYDATQNYTTTFADGTSYTGHVQPTPWVARGKNNLTRFIQTGLLTANSISVSSSTEKTDMRFSVGDTYNRGIVPNTQLNNANFTGSIVQRFTPKLSLTTYFNYSRQSTPNLPDVNYGPNSIIYNIILWGGADWDINDMKSYWQNGKVGIQQKYAEYYRYNNPYFMSYQWLRGHQQNNIYGYLSLNYKLNQNFDFQFRPSLNTYDMFNSEKLPYSADTYGRELRQGDYREDRRSSFENIEDVQARYHQQLFGFLDVAAVGGGTARNLSFNSGFTSTNYLNVPGVYAFSNSLNALTASSFRSDMLVLSAYYSVDLGYKAYITANITGRVDKSSSLPSNTNAYYYPSFNVASVISEYVKLPRVISFLKVRASYAESKDGGTEALFSPDVSHTPAGGYGYYFNSAYGGPKPTYQFSSTYSLQPTYNQQNSASYTSQAISQNIHTAERKALEFGADIRFFDNRIALDVTRYHYRNDAIVSQNISSSSGYSTYLTNGNGYTNDGWEASLSGKILSNPNGFSWQTAINFSQYIRKWVDFSNPTNYTKNGDRIDQVIGTGFVRTPDGKLVIDKASGVYTRFSDLGSSAQKVFGHSDPDWQWGITNTVSYKSFSFRFQFDGAVGGVIEDYVRKKTLQAGRHIESATGALGAARPSDEANVAAYTGDGVNLSGPNGIQLDPITGKISNFKELTETTNTTKSQVQAFVTREANIPDLDIIKKTFAKLREVAITYTLPENILGNNGFVKKASFSLVGRNLLYFFPNKYKDIDVDQYTQSSYNQQSNGQFSGSTYTSGLQTPSTRSFGFNLSLTF